MAELGRRGNMVVRRTVTKDPSTNKYEPTGEIMWWFWCPGCEDLHAYTLPRWTRTGTDEAPTFAPSLLVEYGFDAGSKRCHLFLRDGQLQFLADCTHKLAGKNAPVPEPPEWLIEEGS